MYWTDTPGIGGEIKKYAEDFIVEEKRNNRVWTTRYNLIDRIKKKFVSGEGEHLHLTLIKKNRNTLDVVKEICRQLNISEKKIGYAGLKDKRAITSQRLSIMAKAKDVKKINIDNILLKDFTYQKRKIRIGQLQGNVFTIRIRDVKKDALKILKEFKKYTKLPNLYGPQRFGGNEEIGKEIIRENMKKVANILNSDKRYKKISLNPSKIMRIIPRKMIRLYKDAYQSHIFNKTLCEYGWNAPKYLPLCGYKVDLDEITEKFLKKDKISKINLKKAKMKGTYRKCFFEPKWLMEKMKKNDLIIKFFLPKGSYATVLLGELMKC